MTLKHAQIMSERCQYYRKLMDINTFNLRLLYIVKKHSMTLNKTCIEENTLNTSNHMALHPNSYF